APAAPVEAPVEAAAPVVVAVPAETPAVAAEIPAPREDRVEAPTSEEVAPAAAVAQPEPVETRVAPVEAAPAAVTPVQAPVEAPVQAAPVETAPVAAPAAQRPVQVTTASAASTDSLDTMLASAGLVWVNTDADKLRASQDAAAQVARPARAPRERKALPPVDSTPMQQVETGRHQ
ncbi:MAG: ribonuclease E/G, partial [Paraburkholderia tropica]